MKKILVTLLCLSVYVAAQQHTSAVASKVDALIKKMTLDEKIGQMTQADYLAVAATPKDIITYSIGSILWGGNSEISDVTPKGWAALTDSLQALSQKTRLKIPIIFGIDAVHGHNNVNGAVIFPHNIALGATRNASLVGQVGAVTAAEMRGTGIQWTFAPCVAVVRNERWGRTYESFGEDPALVAELGAAYVKGLQGSGLDDKTSALACVKHFMGDGGTVNGKDQGDTEGRDDVLLPMHLAGYISAIGSGAQSVMASYSSWNGNKMHGHKNLLTGMLKGEMNFQGFLVSDWAGIDQLPGDFKDDIQQSINAGLDMIMIPNGPGQPNNYVQFITLLKELVKEKKVAMNRIDDAVRRILTVKMEMNLSGSLHRDQTLFGQIGSKEHRQVARDAVRQSLVLLKNNGVLPLSPNAKSIVVAGKSADDIGAQCGGWTISWQGARGNDIAGGTTILQGVRNAVSKETRVRYSADGSGIDSGDIAIVVVGEDPYAEMIGDRQDLGLSADDVALVQKVKAAGVPVVVVLLSGRPMIINDALQSGDAFVAAWLPGTEGDGVADVLFGSYRPTGKLPHSWPRSMQQIPINVGDTAYDPLFPFGFGLTYPADKAMK